MRVTNLGEDHGGDLLGGEGVGAAEVLDLDLGVAIAIIDDLEGPRLLVLLDDGVLEAATDEAPMCLVVRQRCPVGAAQVSCSDSEGLLFERAGLLRRGGVLLDVEDGVARVHGGLVLGGLADEALLIGEGDERGGGEATLLVGDDLDIGTLVDGHAGVGGA